MNKIDSEEEERIESRTSLGGGNIARSFTPEAAQRLSCLLPTFHMDYQNLNRRLHSSALFSTNFQCLSSWLDASYQIISVT